MKNKSEPKKRHWSLKMLNRWYAELLLSAIASCMVGCVLWKKALLPLYITAVPNWVLIAVLFFVITFLHTLFTGMLEHFLGKIYPRNEPLEIGRILLFALCGSLIVGVLSGFLEFLYELDLGKTPIPVPKGGVVYVIDDSGSMNGTDPRNKRNQCVVKMNDVFTADAVTGLVRFSDKVDLFLDLAPLSDAHKCLMEQYAMHKASGGGTDIESGINMALEMCETSQVVRNLAEMPHILLLTDGQSACNENAVIQRCVKDGIRIDAISLGVGTDMGLLDSLTSGTGGTLANVPDAFYLEGAFRLLTGSDVKRCLLTPVLLIGKNRGFLRFLQVLFLLLIGLAVETVVTLMLAYTVHVRPHILKSPVLILLGSVLVMLTDATLVSVFMMLGCFLFPFFTGKAFHGFVKRPRIIDPKPYSGFMTGIIRKTDAHFYCKK